MEIVTAHLQHWENTSFPTVNTNIKATGKYNEIIQKLSDHISVRQIEYHGVCKASWLHSLWKDPDDLFDTNITWHRSHGDMVGKYYVFKIVEIEKICVRFKFIWKRNSLCWPYSTWTNYSFRVEMLDRVVERYFTLIEKIQSNASILRQKQVRWLQRSEIFSDFFSVDNFL